ncbi:hypothetical protein VTK56DRAFT_2895 [Thermocarpiscus australiensis]
MAVEGATQALVAAFFFGIVLNAASAALVLYVKGYGVAAFRDSQRLVLILFLSSSALWALIDFIAILLDITRSPTPCQVGVIFSSIFDQLARFSIEQFLLWALNNDNGPSISKTQLISQVLILVRFLAGAVFIGFARPQTDTFCVTTTSALPVGILVAALDAAIIVLFIIRAYSAGAFARGDRDAKAIEADRATALTYVLLGLIFWTGTSVPLLLGIRTIALAARTALPAGGLVVVIVCLASGAGTLAAPRATQSRPPEAPSPRRINISRDISTSDSDYPPSRYEDLKEAAIRSSTTFVNPREAPRIKDDISIGFSLGVTGAPPVPPIPPAAANMPPAVSGLGWNAERSGSQKKGLFNFGKGAAGARSGAKLAISGPILQEDAAQKPWDKIAAIGLEEAAAAEKERRAMMLGDAGAGASRAAVQTRAMTPEEGLKRAVSFKRKEVAPASTLQPESVAVGSTTSAQLSPGGDETRRRSPPPSSGESVEGQSVSSSLVARTGRRSPEPTETPLQRRPTVGLPTHPRAGGLKIAQGPGSRQQTVMFLNNIKYNDPVVVESIIKGASNKTGKPAPGPETPGTSVSIVNRPRPIPRKPAESPAQPSLSPAHRRSRSVGSLGRKSFLSAAQGSPTQLPPLPPLPRSIAMPVRPHRNNTKSMTVDEKMTYLFRSPPSGNTIRRRSSVPEIPAIPVSYLDTSSSPGESDGRWRSDRTTKTSVGTESGLEVYEIPRKPRNVVNTADEAGLSWLSAFGAADDNKPRKGQPTTQEGGKRGSSPVVPAVPVRASAWTESTYDRTEEDTATNWSSLLSPELAIAVPAVHMICVASSVRMSSPQESRESKVDFLQTNNNRKTLPIMIDTSTAQQSGLQESGLLEGEVVATPERAPQSQWHRRVGDQCPSFSARKEKRRSRKLTPPAPLQLHNTTKKQAITIQTEPSPLQSPDQALQQIEAQLKKLEEPEQKALLSPSQPLALLEDLEREMGQQVDHWQEIRHNMGRHSLLSIQTTSPLGRSSRRESTTSIPSVAPESSIPLSIGAERRASRMARAAGGNNLRIPEVSVQDSASPQMSKWQKRLTEAQMDYMDAQLLRNTTANFLRLSSGQLASPTPSDSDQPDQSEDELSACSGRLDDAATKEPAVVHPRPVSLWTPMPKRSTAPAGFLWKPVPKPAPQVELPPPGLTVRPPQRKEPTPLRIESSQLWRKPDSKAGRSTPGLWRPFGASAAPPADPVRRSLSQPASRPQKAPRPVTQRPPRRTKRVTLLPDILESPEPLPDKRGTLGIFQFPWGEKSDTASIQPHPSMSMAMSGTMTSGGPPPGMAIGSHSKQTESAGYSSSFFDDYDDEDEGQIDGLQFDEDDSDDGFDDTTLWEIASLLKSDDVPSKSSLLPPPPSSFVVDDYIDELDSSDDEGESSEEQEIVIGLAEPRELLLNQRREPATIESSAPLMLEDTCESRTAPPQPAARLGFPANPKASLVSQASLGPTAAAAAAAESTASPAPASVSKQLQIPRHAAEVQQIKTTREQVSTGLWYPRAEPEKRSAREGLFTPDPNRSDYRNTSEEPAAKYLRRKLRPAEPKPLDKLTSASLWTPGAAGKHSERNWISATRVSAGLWSPRGRPEDSLSAREGLFKLDKSRSDYRSTSEEPAAKYLRRKPRPAELKPLDKLVSASLWTPQAVVKHTERNWIQGGGRQ